MTVIDYLAANQAVFIAACFVLGLLIGSFVAAWLSGELRVEVLRGPRSPVLYRLAHRIPRPEAGA